MKKLLICLTLLCCSLLVFSACATGRDNEQDNYGGDPMEFERFSLSTSGTTAESYVYEGYRTESGVHLAYYTSTSWWDNTVSDYVESRYVIRAIDGDDALYQTLCALLGDCRINEWAGFRGANPPDVLDGSSMSFQATLPDGSVITASGSNNFPPNYRRFSDALAELLLTEQITDTALKVRASGANILRGGAYKPRTSPYAFQGLKLEGLALLEQAKELTGMPICTEIMSPKLVEEFDRRVDVIQVGARNMQNFDLLTELGQTRKPILLKRGLSATISEWLMSAEYIMAAGNPNVILCERGIRTFETYTRNTLDLSAVQAVKRLSHLPVIVDPSHATGLSWMVERMSLAAIAAGADGLIIEVHNNPPKALCDGAQSLTPDQYAQLVGKISALAPIVERTL